MSHRFEVDPELLRSAARDAGRAAAAASRGELRAATGLGDDRVERAASRVAENWSAGLDHLHTDVTEVSSRLKKTADLYEGGDASGKDAADGVARELPHS